MKAFFVHISGLDRRTGGSGGRRGHGVLRGKFGGQHIGQGIELGHLSLTQGGLERDLLIVEFHALETGENLGHDLAAGGGPGAVFDQGDLTVLQIVGGDIM